MTAQWQDASAIWQPVTGGFDGDISFNNNYTISVSILIYNIGIEFGNDLAYDPINNKIYSGGLYNSIANNGMISYVAWSYADDGVNWYDASAIWHGNTFNGDIYNNGEYVTSLTCDTINNRVYAGGLYGSIANANYTAPFVAYSTDQGITWQDASAIWHSAFNGDISFNATSINLVTSLAHDPFNNKIYAGGTYDSIANVGNQAPFVAWTYANDGVNWYDASAIWHGSTFNGDITYIAQPNVIKLHNIPVILNNFVSGIIYVSSNNRIYAGGTYSSIDNNSASPFVAYSSDAGITWQDASAIWHSGFNGDIGAGKGNVNALAYDICSNRIYAGGNYAANNNTVNPFPFVSWSSVGDGINWHDASAIWQLGTGAFGTDISGGSVTSLTFDSSQGLIYAGGIYNSLSQGVALPFICSSSNGVNWQDASGIWSGNGFDGDMSLNIGGGNNLNIVTAMTYDTADNRVYANGFYNSIANSGNIVPFVVNNGTTTLPPYYSIEFTDTAIFLNGQNSGLTTQTYYLNLVDMSSNVTVTNNLSGGQVGTVKLWVDNSSQTANNVPPGQFIIDGNNITIDGQCTELDLSAETNYTGLVSSVADNSTGIIIKNININLGTNPAATLSNSGNIGYVCHGNMIGVDIKFKDCTLTAGGVFTVTNGGNGGSGGNGGICGGTNVGSLTFTNCRVSAGVNLYVVNVGAYGYNGGICGGRNGGNLSFTDCTVSSGGILYVNNGGGNGYNGGICGGGNGSTLSFTDCNVTARDKLYVSYGGDPVNGGILGGNNIQTLTFTDCMVTAGGDLYVDNGAGFYNGGICGGTNSILSTLSFTQCKVNAIGNLYVGNGGGGICGGSGRSGGISYLTDCIVSAGSVLYLDNNGGGASAGICGGDNISITINFTNCQVQSNNNIFITSPTSTSAGICGGGNDATNTNFNFFLCFVRPGTNTGFSYNGTPITAPNNDRVTLKTKLMIAGQSITNQNQIQIDCVSQLIAVPDYSCNTEPLPPVPPVPPTPAPAPTSNISPLGGGFQGFEPKMVVLVEGGGGRSMTRRILRDAFGTGANNKTRKCTTPFRISVNESCAGKPGKAAVIYSGSDYIRFKKLVAVNKNYNDSSFGGDNNNGSYDALKRARH